MKTTPWLKALALSFSLLPASAAVNAQALQSHDKVAFGHSNGLHSKGHPASKELRDYTQQNVMPVVRQQRQKLDAQLSAADKTQLAGYRAQLKAVREKSHAFRQSLRPEGTAKGQPGQRPELTEAQQQQQQQFRSEQHAVMLNVAQLAQKYSTNIQQLAAEVQPQREKWAADMKAIVLKNATPEQQQKMQQHQNKAGKAGFGGKHHGGHGSMHKYFAPTRFLLMDPNAPAKAEASGASGGRAALYPNPASATQRLEYEVKKEGTVKVELLNEKGITLRTLQDGKLDKGAQSLDVNLSDLPRGTYYYKITGKGLNETRRFVKE
ncbi:T9SS type A sorting domain-containing protein [Hymenobacter busanensis]|uniref:T9SS type A sorting domain-containing protein n=1 Tax=Hymenobacter busanensis TaxID=2607656 RepID=A0A7L4ZVJ1_9BACT|nr:T9SS type A sorting domain-containing protein [Hymenobacter busanensis]KAA9332444.1 T9SS type A sorting domain-containing protein [Hymenobacter busanensis]QHJ07218.1 T9SS type A sorting domain-containing protein [Hymenobacter busanensis]